MEKIPLFELKVKRAKPRDYCIFQKINQPKFGALKRIPLILRRKAIFE